MTTTTLQEQARARGDPTRHLILRQIAQAARRGDRRAQRHFPLSHNAMRQHLAKLAAAGLVVETKAPHGRPCLVYEVDPAVEGPCGPPDAGGHRTPRTTATCATAMARQGFDPEVRPVPGGAEIVLHSCPFATSALADRDTSCALHLGITEGPSDVTVAVAELIAYDSRKAGCRLRIRLAADETDANGKLILRGKARPR